MPVLRIVVISDFVCPWCYIGERKLELALAEMPDLEVSLEWRPYQLHPYLPEEGMDLDAFLLRKYGKTSRTALRRIEQNAQAIGLELDFDAVTRVPHTLAAHCLVRWAEAAGLATAMAKRLFHAYFVEGQDIGEHQVLARLARDVGLDAATVTEALASGDGRDEVTANAQDVRESGVTGVPFFLFDGTYPVMGAQEPDTLRHVVNRVLAKRTEGLSE